MPLNERKASELRPEDGFQAPKNIVARRNQDGTVVLMKMDESSIFFKIDGIAAKIWAELENKKTLRELTEKFSSVYPDHRENLAKDIPAFLNDLLQRELVLKI